MTLGMKVWLLVLFIILFNWNNWTLCSRIVFCHFSQTDEWLKCFWWNIQRWSVVFFYVSPLSFSFLICCCECGSKKKPQISFMSISWPAGETHWTLAPVCRKASAQHKTSISMFHGKATTLAFRGDLWCILEPLRKQKTQKSQLSF